MKRGPKPKPTSIKLLASNPGKRPISRQEPKPGDDGVPDPPDTLCEKAQDVWRKTAPILQRMGTLTNADHGLFLLYCNEWATYYLADSELQEHGHTVTVGDAKYRQAACWLGIRNTAGANINRLGAELGLSASARTRIAVDKPKKATGKDRFFTAG